MQIVLLFFPGYDMLVFTPHPPLVRSPYDQYWHPCFSVTKNNMLFIRLPPVFLCCLQPAVSITEDRKKQNDITLHQVYGNLIAVKLAENVNMQK